MINNLVENTNLYTVQKSGTNIKTNEKEIKQVIGMFFCKGLVRMSGVRQYWEIDTK